MTTPLSNYARILRAFRQRPGASYRAIANRVGVSQSTVWYAVDKAIESGDMKRGPCACCGGQTLIVVGESVEAAS